MTMFVRVRSDVLLTKFREIEGRSKFTLDRDDVDEIPNGIDYVYMQRIVVKGGVRARSYTYLRVSSKPKDVMMSEVEGIVTELRGLGIEYDATMAVHELFGQRTYVDGSGASELLMHIGMATALGPIWEHSARYLLILKVYKNNLVPADRKLVVRTSNHHSFLMSDEEDDMIRLKLKHGGKLLDVQELREKGRTSDYTG